MLKSKSEQPLYLQLVDRLEATIRDQLVAHDKLPSERELTEHYSVSRITVRLALQELENRGLVYRQQGRGTFVSDLSQAVVDLSATYSFTEQMRQMGKVPKTLVLSFAQEKAPRTLADEMGLTEDEEIYVIERLRLADGIKMMLETSYVPVIYFPSLNPEMLENKPLYDIFAEDFKQSIKVAEEEFYASLALPYDAEQLDILINSPVLQLQRKSFNAKNKLIEYTISVARADQFRYRITHRQPKKNLFGLNFNKKNKSNQPKN